MMRGSRHIAGSWVCRVFRFYVCVVFIVSGCRKEKNERHFAWLLIALLVCHNLTLCVFVCVIFSLWSFCGISLFFSQNGGAIYSSNSDALTFEGSATFTSCSAEASGSFSSSFSSYYYYDSSSSSSTEAVSGGE